MSFLLFLCPLPRAAEVLWLFAVPRRSCGSSWSMVWCRRGPVAPHGLAGPGARGCEAADTLRAVPSADGLPREAAVLTADAPAREAAAL